MPRLIILRGLPAAGKTSLALAICRDRHTVVRVSRDDIRRMMMVQLPTVREALAEKLRDLMIINSLSAGLDVISDDTNLTRYNVERLSGFAKMCGADVEVIDLMEDRTITVEVCIARDAERFEHQVGEAVIRRLAATYQPL